MSEPPLVSTEASPPPPTPPPPPPSVVAEIADGVERSLDPRYISLRKRAGWIGVAVRSLMWLGLTIGLLAVAPGISWLRIPLFALWALVTAALAVFSQRWPAVAYRHFFYRVDQRGIEIKQGVLWRTVTTVPRSRVQHIDVSQGPFERRLDLGTVTIHTAGTQDATVSLPGLEYGLALALREHLLPKREHDVV